MDNNRQLIELIYGDTDSLYMSYDGLLSTIEGIENMSLHEKTEIIAKINSEFLDQHNCDYITEQYNKRFAKSVHAFELETIALAGIWLNVKKRYAQILTWKDGKFFDEDSLPMKIKGLEVIKASYPALARQELKQLIRDLIETDDPHILHIMNNKMQEARKRWMEADVEQICQTKSANNYTKYILDDTSEWGLKVAPKCPAHLRGLGEYNRMRQTKGLKGEPCYCGKVRFYIVNQNRRLKSTEPEAMFAFPSGMYPKWADQYAPVDRDKQFKSCILDPFNRILEAMLIQPLTISGNIMTSLFDEF